MQPQTRFEYTNQTDRPVWPLPSIGTAGPIIVGVSERHLAMELGYSRSVAKPSMLPVLAVGHGEIDYATDDRITIDHDFGIATAYLGLDIVLADRRSMRARKPRVRVKPGEVIGFITDHHALAFEIWRHENKRRCWPESLGGHLPHWDVVPWIRPANDNTKTESRRAA